MRKWLRGPFAAILMLLTGTAIASCDGVVPSAGGATPSWPPKLGQPYPEIEFTNFDGRKLRMSDLRGKVVLVEPIGMTCKACNAFSGGNERGGVGHIQPQRNLESIERYLSDYASGTTLDRHDFVLVQVVLYDIEDGPVEIEDARVWAEHFGLDRNPNVYVVFSERDLRGRASFAMIPGFQLLDRDGVMRFDSTGHRPRHNLYTQLLPQVPELLSN